MAATLPVGKRRGMPLATMADDRAESGETREAVPAAVSAAELRAVLASDETFADLSDATVQALADCAQWVFVPAGHLVAVARTGELMESAYVIAHGRLRVTLWEGRKRLAAEVGRGEFTLLASILSPPRAEGNVVALRDSALIRIDREDVLRCMAGHTDMISAFARYAQDGAYRLVGWGGGRNRPQTFAVLPASGDPGNREAAESLLQAFSELRGEGTLVDSQRLGEVLGETPDSPEKFDRVRRRLSRWCGEQEAAGRFVLFFADAADTPWTRWCLDQTDRIVVVARSGAVSELERIDRAFAGRLVAGEPIKVDLVLRQDPDIVLPRGTGAWWKLACRRRHHHVRRGNMADFRRAVRRMTERAVGVVLGGGGARGLAHIGVLQALDEAGVPIDVIGGTSMGSVMAAAYARGWSPQHTLHMISQLLPDRAAVRDLDLPLVSLLMGRKLDRVIETAFEDYDISDLWLPFYCVSANLSDGRMMVHDRGRVWKNVRASCSLPGIFPPVRQDGKLLVDGGVVNNVPIDIMRRECEGGTVIAIDVGTGGAQHADLADRDVSGWSLMRNRLNPLSRNEPLVSLVQVLTWSTTISSKQYMKQLINSGHVDLLLRLPVAEFELLAFDAYSKLYEIGYEYTRRQLAEWDGLAAITSNL